MASAVAGKNTWRSFFCSNLPTLVSPDCVTIGPNPHEREGLGLCRHLRPAAVKLCLCNRATERATQSASAVFDSSRTSDLAYRRALLNALRSPAQKSKARESISTVSSVDSREGSGLREIRMSLDDAHLASLARASPDGKGLSFVPSTGRFLTLTRLHPVAAV